MKSNKKVPIIAVTGGKGGTGKTLIATNIAVLFANQGKKTLLIDCDVENPNTNILLGKKIDDSDIFTEPVDLFIPSFDNDKCSQCGVCRDSCYRHAILQFSGQFPVLMDHMCSGCQTCMKVCNFNAIKPGSKPIGKRHFIEFSGFENLHLLIGELFPSEAMSVAIVKNLLEYTNELKKIHHYDIIIIDTAPGAHCDVEHSIADASLILCVTEPTPFGEHDLKRILELIEIVGNKAQVILNRADMSDYRKPLESLSDEMKSPIIGEIPLDRIVVEDYARGVPFALDSRDFPAKTQFIKIFNHIKSILEGNSL